uniref:HAT C-terminal dimerisation domain-containing protein n=1 Tax=Panagrolaimus sp. ES5 TaxID=591445 RepID=A0AC34G9R7_9BILA
MLAPYNRKLTHSLIDIFDTDEMIIELKRDFYTMIYKFMGRPEAMAQLCKQVGYNVTLPIGEPFFILAENLLKVKSAFLTVCCQQPLDNPIPVFSESQWQQLEHSVKLLGLFRVHMSVIQDGRYATIDRVVPSLMQLKVSLERDFSALGTLPHRLLEDLHQRAQYILDSTAENFDGSFIQATALNPQLAMLLDDSQMTFAKSSIEKLLSERMRQNDESLTRKNGVKSNGGGVDALLAAVVERKNSNVSSSAAISPPLSSPSSTASDMNATSSASTASTLYPDLIQAANQRRKQFQDRLSNGKNLFAEAMVQSYFDDLMNTVASSPSSTDAGMPSQAATLPPLQFWQLSSVKCPQLSDIAIELLTVPSCTVSLEKIFNYEGVSQAAHSSLEHQLLKSMENPTRMERDAILRFNRAFIPKHF